MLKVHARTVATTLFVADLTLTILSFLGSYALMAGPNKYFGALNPLDHYLWLLLFIIPVWTTVLQFSGTYRSQRVQSVLVDLWRVSRAALLGGIALFAFVGLMKAS